MPIRCTLDGLFFKSSLLRQFPILQDFSLSKIDS